MVAASSHDVVAASSCDIANRKVAMLSTMSQNGSDYDTSHIGVEESFWTPVLDSHD
jgi:hypothetical protein